MKVNIISMISFTILFAYALTRWSVPDVRTSSPLLALYGHQALPSESPPLDAVPPHFLYYFSSIYWLSSGAHGTIFTSMFGVVPDNCWQRQHHLHFTHGEAQIPNQWTQSKQVLPRNFSGTAPALWVNHLTPNLSTYIYQAFYHILQLTYHCFVSYSA